METFSALLAICAGNSPVTGEFPAQRPVTRSFDVFFDLHQNKWLSVSEQSWSWWFETPSRALWRHCNRIRVTRFVHNNKAQQNINKAQQNFFFFFFGGGGGVIYIHACLHICVSMYVYTCKSKTIPLFPVRLFMRHMSLKASPNPDTSTFLTSCSGWIKDQSSALLTFCLGTPPLGMQMHWWTVDPHKKC